MKKYDVVVVGGGPSGIITAISLARKGRAVALVDKKPLHEIGRKTCGDALDKATVDLIKDKLGINAPRGNALNEEIKIMSIAGGDIDTKFSLTAPGYMVDRHAYGQYLVELAIESGVTLLPSRTVKRLIIEGERVQGVETTLKPGGEKEAIGAKFTVDASGAYATVRKLLPESFLEYGLTRELSKDMVWPSYREIIRLKHTDHRWRHEIILQYPHSIPVPGYFWIFTKGEATLNVGIGWLKSEEGMGNMKEAYLTELRKYFKPEEYEVLSTGGGQIPIRIPFDNLLFPGGLIVGDAGCMVHPTTAEGHGPALESGMWAAEAIEKALVDENSLSLWDYNVKIAQHLGLKHANAYAMRRFIEKIGSKGLEKIIKRSFITNHEMDELVRGKDLVLSSFQKLIRALKMVPHLGIVRDVVWFQNLLSSLKEIYAQFPRDSEGIEEWRERRNEIIGMDF